MPEASDWCEVESEVHAPGRWLPIVVGTVFLLIAVAGFANRRNLPLGVPVWIPSLIFGAFALFGLTAWTWVVRNILLPARIRHASPDVLPNVPQEPVIVEGSTVHGRLTHELLENSQHWQFQPARRLWRNDRGFFLGFGIPFLVFFAGLLSWVFHTEHKFSWPISILGGVIITAACGGSTFVLIGMILRAGYRRLCSLRIPRNGDDLELDSPETVDPGNKDLSTGLKWIFQGPTGTQRLTISRERLKAVQLCPWKFVAGESDRNSTWAVQGLLVLESPETNVYQRLPLLLTSDFAGAARLMQLLATTLHVPYIFCADAEGWKAEEIRAKNRPPLRAGGMMS